MSPVKFPVGYDNLAESAQTVYTGKIAIFWPLNTQSLIFMMSLQFFFLLSYLTVSVFN